MLSAWYTRFLIISIMTLYLLSLVVPIYMCADQIPSVCVWPGRLTTMSCRRYFLLFEAVMHIVPILLLQRSFKEDAMYQICKNGLSDVVYLFIHKYPQNINKSLEMP